MYSYHLCSFKFFPFLRRGWCIEREFGLSGCWHQPAFSIVCAWNTVWSCASLHLFTVSLPLFLLPTVSCWTPLFIINILKLNETLNHLYNSFENLKIDLLKCEEPSEMTKTYLRSQSTQKTPDLGPCYGNKRFENVRLDLEVSQLSMWANLCADGEVLSILCCPSLCVNTRQVAPPCYFCCCCCYWAAKSGPDCRRQWAVKTGAKGPGCWLRASIQPFLFRVSVPF